MKAFVLTIVCGILFVTGCQMEPTKDIKPLQLSNEVLINQEQADEAKQIVLSMEEVVEIKGVAVKDAIYLAPRVKHFDRFRLNEIRKSSHQAVKKKYPNASVHVSTDQKIFMELEKLEQALKNRSISEKRLENKLTELEDMMKG
ncbi:hypothetical protein [Bacillus suaedae]|uniref:Sporulation protein n=1 Tax=Halalkalibacter suaedae TaxID=2822140 RepID=A0A940WUJ6_9BACI|nr:hypothetical protein [Bacillus suaedae]MBP3950523.1 hypothetical protein [Bacillus suaedae]